VQALLSSQLTAAPAWHVPPAQVSAVVQAFPSSHAAVLFVWRQPVARSQVSVVHGLLSSQFGPGPLMQDPLLHVSPMVHAFPSSQAAVLFVKTQPVAGLQLSVVQMLPSLQTSVAPA
jgi:hypothetical protein